MSASPRLLALSLTFLVGCGNDKGNDSACIEGAAMPSVQVVVTDMTAATLADATVTWSTGGEETPCDQVDTQFLCGMDEAGTVTVTASAPGYITQTIDYTVKSDGCHVITVEEAIRMTEE